MKTFFTILFILIIIIVICFILCAVKVYDDIDLKESDKNDKNME